MDEMQVQDRRLEREGRTIAWTEWGVPDGTPVVRFPGTPSCRLHQPATPAAWRARGLRCITTERPGFGATTHLSEALIGRGFRETADDIAAILDHLHIDKAYLFGTSGGGPHALAFAAFYPQRVVAVTIVSGAAPLTDSDAASLIQANAEARQLALSGDRAALTAMYETMRNDILANPLGALQQIIADAPEADKHIMQDAGWQRMLATVLPEALKQGVTGWIAEDVALVTPYDFAPEHVTASVTWWHSAADRNVPIAASQRMIDQMPNARLQPLTGGHIALGMDATFLDELLRRP